MPEPLVNLAETVVVKEGNLFAVTRRDGGVPSEGETGLGFYREDCRFVSTHELSLQGVRPRLLVASTPVGSESLHELTNPPLELSGRGTLPLQSLRIRLERTLSDPDTVSEVYVIGSYAHEPIELELELALRADFEPMLAIRGIVPRSDPARVAVEPVSGGVRFAVRGRDGIYRATTVTARPAPSATEPDGRLHFRMALEPGASETLTLHYVLHHDHRPAAAPQWRAPRDLASRRSEAEAWLHDHTGVTTDDELFNRVLQRSILDVGMLRSRIDDESYYAAGIPWYATLFGRDSIITAFEMLAFDPRMAAQTLRLLARLIGTDYRPESEEQPGKVLHELRMGEVANLRLTPLARYYGSVDATSLYLCLLCEYVYWTGDLTLFRELRPAVEAMLGWLDRDGDANGDGLLDYRAHHPHGLRNQGWKDSHDAILDEHGVPLEPPIALVEAQAYAIRARSRLAALYDSEGERDTARELRDGAAALAGRLERFWLPDLGYYGMAMDGEGRVSRALASNQGHVLWAMTLPAERAGQVADAVMGERMFSGWGIRTLAEGTAGYNPVGYHLGTVWPHDTAMIAVGLRKHGHDQAFLRVFEGLLEAASRSESYRLPELFAGFPRTQFESPVPYPVACHPQAWAAGAIPYLLRHGLGLLPDAAGGRLRIRRPSMPGWLNRVQVSGLRVADSRVDLLFERPAGSDHVALSDARIRGDVEVVLEISGDPLATRA